MTGKRHEIVKLMVEKNIEILCVQETRWGGSKAYGIGNGFKMFYHGHDNRRNGVGVIVSPELKDKVIEVGRKSDRVMHITVEIESELWTIVSCYAPQTGCEEEEKMRFWSDLDEVVQTIDRNERLVIAGDFNGHVGGENTGFEEVHGGHGIGLPNPEGIAILDFATAYQLRIVNTMFTKLPNHLVTYNSGNNQSQIDFILVRSAHI